LPAPPGAWSLLLLRGKSKRLPKCEDLVSSARSPSCQPSLRGQTAACGTAARCYIFRDSSSFHHKRKWGRSSVAPGPLKSIESRSEFRLTFGLKTEADAETPAEKKTRKAYSSSSA
jgi:hypothetical protein